MKKIIALAFIVGFMFTSCESGDEAMDEMIIQDVEMSGGGGTSGGGGSQNKPPGGGDGNG